MAFGARVKIVGNKCKLTHGWSDFVNGERISRFDSAVFSWLESNKVGVRLYGADGNEKPFASRPEPGHPLLDDFPELRSAGIRGNNTNVASKCS